MELINAVAVDYVDPALEGKIITFTCLPGQILNGHPHMHVWRGVENRNQILERFNAKYPTIGEKGSEGEQMSSLSIKRS